MIVFELVYFCSSCSLYSTKVSVYYDPSKFILPTTVLPDTQCFTSWYDSKDLTPQIAATQASPLYPPLNNFWTFDKYFAFDGYLCPKSLLQLSFYASVNQNGPGWFIVDLGKSYKILKVIVQTRGWAAFFQNAELRVGDQNSTGNPLWAFYLGPAPSGTAVTFQNQSPGRGRYVSLTVLDNYLVIGDWKIIGEI
ncbi:unnamed protein product [Rotaria socialis]|uniref:Uncharacterized protein n=1 Tax=Rotaria socialis TaxID=392032 RepID=A0A821S2R3_9BILA|nr:unnamed protein product [Rotaria socialis]CAF4851189.1 unnamed protein product [Rotaria socialis]